MHFRLYTASILVETYFLLLFASSSLLTRMPASLNIWNEESLGLYDLESHCNEFIEFFSSVGTSLALSSFSPGSNPIYCAYTSLVENVS